MNLTTTDILLALIAIALWVALFTGWDGIQVDAEITARLNAGLTNIYNDWFKVVKQLADEGEPRAQALLAPTTSLDLVYGISVEPDTVIVLHSDEPLNPEQASQLKTQMQDLYPDNTVIVTQDGLRVSTREGR